MINRTGTSFIRTGLATALVLVLGLSTAWGGDFTETGLQGHYRVDDPDDPDDPQDDRPDADSGEWTPIASDGSASDSITVASGESIHIGFENDAAFWNKKRFWFAMKVSPASAARYLTKRNVAAEYQPSATGVRPDGTATTTDISAVGGSNSGWIKMVGSFYHQPAWEYITLTNTNSNAITFTITRLEMTTKCKLRSDNESPAAPDRSFDLTDAYFGAAGHMVNATDITTIEVFPEYGTVDPAVAPAFTAANGGVWTSEFINVDPEGTTRSGGGVRWTAATIGLAAQDAYSASLATLDQADTVYRMYAWDADAATYQNFLFEERGFPWGENFEMYEDGDGMYGQRDWTLWDDDIDNDAVSSAAQAHGGSKSALVSDLADLVYPFDGATDGQWTLVMQQFIPTDFSGSCFIILMNRYAPLAHNSPDWSLQLEIDASSGLLNDFDGTEAMALITGDWAEIRIEIDLDTDVQSVYYNGQHLVTKSWTAGVEPGGLAQIGAIDLWANESTGVYYDDLRLQRVIDDCPADVDGDGAVGFSDLLLVLSSWGTCEGACIADLDGSGDVGFADLLIVLSAWGECL